MKAKHIIRLGLALLLCTAFSACEKSGEIAVRPNTQQQKTQL